MAIDAIGVTPSSGSSDLSQSSAINQQDFLKIMMTQLRNQDPLKPMDNQQFLAQLAQFSALELSREQKTNTDTLLAVQSNTQAVELLGRNVEVATDSGSQVGNVTAISIASGTPALTIVTSAGVTLTNVSPSKIILVRPTQSGN
jgi:flagellar basal-body rod modification protein FlgD